MACVPKGTDSWGTDSDGLCAKGFVALSAARTRRRRTLATRRLGRIVRYRIELVRPGDGLGGAQRLAIMAVDFSRWSSRSFDCLVAPTGCRRDPRPVKSRLSSLDAADTRQIVPMPCRVSVSLTAASCTTGFRLSSHVAPVVGLNFGPLWPLVPWALARVCDL